MTLQLLLVLLTLPPGLLGIVVLALGLAGRAQRVLALALTALGLLLPLGALLLLTPDLSGVPLRFALFGRTNDWLGLTYRVDSLTMFAAWGLVVLVAPLLAWLAWRLPDDAEPGTALGRTRVAGLAIVLLLETAALTLLFADSLLWMGIAWLVVAALTWALGELGSDTANLDRLGLGFMLAGPVLVLGALLLAAAPARTPCLAPTTWGDLTGCGAASTWHVVLLAAGLALASGCYPFLVWVQRRASFATPAGLGAIALLSMPLVLFVGGRVYSAWRDGAELWPQIGTLTPPLTIGIVLALVGGLTVAVCGALGLGVANGRALLSLFVVAQAGWGLIALGIGQPGSMLALVVLLATSVFGLGAMLAALVAGGMLTADVEPEGAGPQVEGAPLRPLPLLAWTLGGLSLLGVPLLGGFVALQILTSDALLTARLNIPLLGLAWAGDALLALAFVRATAPALVQSAQVARWQWPRRAADWATELVPVALGALALIVGIVPQALFAAGGNDAAQVLVFDGSIAATIRNVPSGYALANGQWQPQVAWLALALWAVALTLLLRRRQRVIRPLAVAASADETATATTLAAPEDAWAQLQPAFTSSILQPGQQWLLAEEDEDAEAGDPEEEPFALAPAEGDSTETPQATDVHEAAVRRRNATPATRAESEEGENR